MRGTIVFVVVGFFFQDPQAVGIELQAVVTLQRIQSRLCGRKTGLVG